MQSSLDVRWIIRYGMRIYDVLDIPSYMYTLIRVAIGICSLFKNLLHEKLVKFISRQKNENYIYQTLFEQVNHLFIE